ncbi:MAG: glutamate 5-kinase [SAR202 cluster bacterium]|nr:glutamate 5-kinase [SAR202 cluster bacterium]
MTTSYKYRRVVIKAGTALLTYGGSRPNLKMMATLVDQIAQLRAAGVETLLVTSGAVAAGRHVLGVQKGAKNVPFRQVLAAIGQGRLMNAYNELFDWHEIPIAQALLTRNDLGIVRQRQRKRYLNVRNTLLTLLELKVIPIINENDVVAVDELAGEGFGDNDNLSAMVANVIDADLLVMLGVVKGLFTADPNVDPEARMLEVVDEMDEKIIAMGGAPRDNKGRGGMATKLEAARLATASGIDTVIASGVEPNVLTRLAGGERIGTLFPATSTKMESRKRWMLSSLTTECDVVVDEGAAAAIHERHRSLLPAGVQEVCGTFDRGDVIAIVDSSRRRIAAGITNYDSADVDKIKGCRSDRIEEMIGNHYGEEIVHRNNMVLV